MEVKIIMIIVVIILIIIEIIIIVIIVMMIRIKIIEENVMGRRGVYFKSRSSQKFCKVDGFKTSKLKLHQTTNLHPVDVSHYYVSWASPRVIKQFLYT